MKSELYREFEYTYAVVRNEGSTSVFMTRGLESINEAIVFLENNHANTSAKDQIIVEYHEL